MIAWADADQVADLQKLAADLDGGEYAVTLVTGQGNRPHLHITNRAVPQLTENIYVDNSYFWWGWSERMAPVTDATGAAAKVARVLRCHDIAPQG